MAPRAKPSLFGGALDQAFGRFLRRMPKQSRSRALVSAIVQAFDEQLQAGADIDAVTVEVLSERAGVGIGSFYEYFASKDSLLGALVGQVTDRNFKHLSAKLDTIADDDLEGAVHVMAREMAATYLDHPRRTRAVVAAIGRLGLMPVVDRERDRFAALLAERAARMLPDAAPERLQRTMELVADGATGIVIAAAGREPPATTEVVAGELLDVALGIIRRRHPQGSH